MSVDRGFTWMDDETIALIDIYSKEEVQQELSGSKRNISVYERIAREMSEIGYRRTANQCREKMKRLRKEYNLAKYCMEHDIINKKPMKYYDLVDKLFNRDSSEPNNCIDFGLLSSEFEDELHFSFTHDQESDASNSCSGIEQNFPHAILPGPSSSPDQDHESSIASIIDSKNSPSKNNHSDSNDAFLLNGEPPYCSDSPLEDSESPWVPNVVLVENDLANSNVGNCSEKSEVFDDFLHHNGSLHNLQVDDSEGQDIGFEDSQEPPQKRKKPETAQHWFRNTLESVTDTFLKFHETAESRFLERITHLEQERMKRDERLQKLWMDFEERRRKEEQLHEIKMMTLLGQFICQFNHNENNST